MGDSIPDLPVLTADESMLSRKFGRELTNYFSGSPLNRVSFLRGDHVFLRSAFAHPSAAFLLMDSLSPLVQQDRNKLAFLSTADVVPLTGPDPFAKPEEETIRDYNSEEKHPLIVFLGIHEKNKVSSGSSFEYKGYKGSPFFAVDATPREPQTAKANGLLEALNSQGFSINKAPRHMGFSPDDAAIYGQARALLGWNTRNPFCAQCGQPTLSVNAGGKRVCPPTDMAGGTKHDRKPCGARVGVSNHSFPRTDPVIIVAVVSADGQRVLLGRSKHFPPHWYSTLAGFLEPGESVEEAVRREVWEETGVVVGHVVLQGSQPWPFPANLMLGAVAQAVPGGENIDLGNDPELEDAKWYTFDELRRALKNNTSPIGEPAPEGYVEGELRLPPQTAIANRLITAVVDGLLAPVTKI